VAFDVFISYSTKDIDVVTHIKDMLANDYVSTFFAEHSVEPGDSLTKKIYAAIRATDLFLLLWSSNSEDSEWVQRELELARSEEKLIVPIKLDESSELPGTISDIKYIPYHEDPRKVPDWINQNVFEKAKAKSNQQIIWLVIGGALLWLATRK